MEHCEQETLRRGCSRLNLSVAVDNQQAIRFYEGLGWKKIFNQPAIWTGQMQKDLDHG
jgi:ribosomal protein S18 acetylase RimI-like enzyme